MPPTLTPSKEFLEEKVGLGFGAARKRPLIKEEQDDSEEGEREKRAKLSTGENFRNVPSHSHFHLPLLFISFCCNFDTPGFIPVRLRKKQNKKKKNLIFFSTINPALKLPGRLFCKFNQSHIRSSLSPTCHSQFFLVIWLSAQGGTVSGALQRNKEMCQTRMVN